MKLFEQLLDLVSTFTFRRALSLIAICTIVLSCTWLIDAYSGYTTFYRFEKTVSLLERIDDLERKGPATKEVAEVRQSLLAQLHSVSLRATTKEESKPPQLAWSAQMWSQMLWGALPWFTISLFSLPAILRRERNAWAGFFAVQIFPVLFAFVNLAIPDSGVFWLDRIFIPWGVFFVCAIIPISIAAVGAFKKVRDNSIQKTIFNNLRQIASASEQFVLEHGRDPAGLQEITGKYIKVPVSVDGERYDLLDLRLDQPLVVVRKSGEVVRYER